MNILNTQRGGRLLQDALSYANLLVPIVETPFDELVREYFKLRVEDDPKEDQEFNEAAMQDYINRISQCH